MRTRSRVSGIAASGGQLESLRANRTLAVTVPRAIRRSRQRWSRRHRGRRPPGLEEPLGHLARSGEWPAGIGGTRAHELADGLFDPVEDVLLRRACG